MSAGWNRCSLSCNRSSKPISGPVNEPSSCSKAGIPQSKGGIVRRLGWALDPRSFKVYPIAAPLLHERGQHYLQRFWQKLPDPGQIVVFDRSWYGRVLVERVEGLASKSEWQRAYEEINEFEQMMVADGIRIAKFFLHITPAEQARRFKDRITNPLKRWKLSYEDFRNRSRWAD